MGNVWDLRYEERSGFHAVTRSCRRPFLTVSNFSLLFWTIWTQMCMFCYKGDYTEKGAWPTASEKGGRCVVVEKDSCLTARSSVVPLGLSGQSALSSLWPPVPFLHRWEEHLKYCNGEYGECKPWWQHVKQLGSLAGAQFLSGPFIACMKNTFLTKHGNPASWRIYTALGETTVLSSRFCRVLGGGQGIIIWFWCQKLSSYD